MSSAQTSWTVRIDRRKASYEAVAEELESLATSIQGLDVELVESETFWKAPDSGAFRDFVPLAIISHAASEALEIVAEELLVTFGWLVDIQRPEQGK